MTYESMTLRAVGIISGAEKVATESQRMAAGEFLVRQARAMDGIDMLICRDLNELLNATELFQQTCGNVGGEPPVGAN